MTFVCAHRTFIRNAECWDLLSILFFGRRKRMILISIFRVKLYFLSAFLCMCVCGEIKNDLFDFMWTGIGLQFHQKSKKKIFSFLNFYINLWMRKGILGYRISFFVFFCFFFAYFNIFNPFFFLLKNWKMKGDTLSFLISCVYREEKNCKTLCTAFL